MKVEVVTLFPEMILGALGYGVLGQALEKKLLEVSVVNPRDYAEDRHRSVDDRPFGGGDGMIMLADPLKKLFEEKKHKNSKVIYLSPQGPTLTAQKAKDLSQAEHVILLCGRYGGVDQRVLNSFVDEELSIGDYVLSGGELGALVVIDSLSRFIPGVLGHADSAEKDSFSDGLLEEPHFTRPREVLEQSIPEILFSGHHEKIETWKHQVSVLVTLVKRPDLFKKYIFEKTQLALAQKKKKRPLPIEELKEFFRSLSENDKKTLGLSSLREEDIHE